MQIEVTGATVIQHGNQMDNVVIDTNLPSPVAAEISDAPLTLLFYAAKGSGVEYVRKNFGLEPTVVTMP